MRRRVTQSLFAVLVLGAGCVGFWLGRDSRNLSTAATTPATGAEADAPEPVATVQTRPAINGTVRRMVDAYGSVQSAPGSSSAVSAPFDATVTRLLVVPAAKVTASTNVIEVAPTAEAKLSLQQAVDAASAADRLVAEVHRRIDAQLATNADLTTAEQAQQTARTQLTNLQQRGIGEARTLPAGAAGYVGSIAVQPGQVVTAGMPLVAIESDRGFEAVIGVNPVWAADLNVGDAVELRDLHAPDDAAPVVGTIRLIGTQVDPQSRMLNVTLALPDDSPLLRGTFVSAAFATNRASGLVVPRSAVVPDGDESVLFVVQDGKAQRRTVTVVLSGRDDVVVQSDALQRGDMVVTEGNGVLEDGMAVTVEQPPATAPTTDRHDETPTAPATEEAK